LAPFHTPAEPSVGAAVFGARETSILHVLTLHPQSSTMVPCAGSRFAMTQTVRAADTRLRPQAMPQNTRQGLLCSGTRSSSDGWWSSSDRWGGSCWQSAQWTPECGQRSWGAC